jgi:AcrR family transcriptional regulator
VPDVPVAIETAPDNATAPCDETINPCDPVAIRRGRPSIAEAEALSGRILDASWAVLLAGGFENFTFDRVARHAHIGKATIYSRFPGKIELMQALLLRRIEQRTDQIRQQGYDLPIESAFRLRAADTMKLLFSPDGVMTERLIEWLDQEIGEGPQMRANVYRNAIESISDMLVRGSAATLRLVPDVDLAARLWLEGLLGHARLAYTEGASSPAEIERWARDYTLFFFAGLRAMSPEA